MKRCPYCQQTTRQNKAGKTDAGSQRYRCMHCNRKYTPEPKSQGYPESLRKRAAAMYLDGNLGNTFHEFFDFLNGFSTGNAGSARSLDATNLWADNDPLWLTVPRQRYDIRSALMKLILNAEKSIFIRTWYFLPDDEMLNVLCAQAQKGVQVNVLLSHETRVRPVDFANYIHVHKLVCAGGNVHRYTGKYMHSKAAWNDQGQVLFGSANLDPHSMRINFESCLQINGSKLTWELRRAFYADLQTSVKQTPQSYLQRSFAGKALTHACNLASPWL